MTTKTLQAEELIISLPEKCLLTSNTVLNSYLREYILKWKPPISPVIALCSFLIAEKWFHRKSVWKPYLDLLPETYTCPVYLEQETVNLFPEPLKRKALEQRSLIQDLFASSKRFFSSLQPLFPEDVEIIFNFSAFQWAWCTINTRTVFMKHSQKDCFSREPDIYALAPFLDLAYSLSKSAFSSYFQAIFGQICFFSFHFSLLLIKFIVHPPTHCHSHTFSSLGFTIHCYTNIIQSKPFPKPVWNKI
uniref:SET domain containing 4 n=1 Tax=Laticauda laticaudata TaxID=8630 RepID=A0A8C5RR25_LATLA